jgi:hypothetical protein
LGGVVEHPSLAPLRGFSERRPPVAQRLAAASAFTAALRLARAQLLLRSDLLRSRCRGRLWLLGHFNQRFRANTEGSERVPAAIRAPFE